MKIYIKNMVCNRCILVVKTELEKLGHQLSDIKLGEVSLQKEELTEEEYKMLDQALIPLGFERIDDRKSRLITKMKACVIKNIESAAVDGMSTDWSSLLSDTLHYDYHYLSRLFSSVEGLTLEQYIIRQKIEKVKEWLVYDELSLNEIAWKLGYSSTAHLSSQFKKITGLTTSHFRKLKDKKRKPLDSL
jgi:AraC-like DNA-binding protein